MKKENRSKVNKTTKSWLGLLTYRIAQDPAKLEGFPGRIKDMVSNAFQNYNFDTLKEVMVNTNSAESKTRLMPKLRSSKSQKRVNDWLEVYPYYQGTQAAHVKTDSIREHDEDYIDIWAKATDQDPIQFMERVRPKVMALVSKWQKETDCSGLTDSETLEYPKEASKFISGLTAVLVQETPADKLQGLTYKMCQTIHGLQPQELLSSLDAPLTRASAMITVQTANRIQEVLASNPTVKECILQQEFGALAELGAKSSGVQDNYQQAVEQLREKLSPELATQGVEVDTELMDKTIAQLDKTDILTNLKDTISGNLNKRYVETAMALWKTLRQRVKSIWQFPESESPATKDGILDLLFRRKTDD